MLNGEVTFIKALRDFFVNDRRPLTVPEMKALTTQDREELREELIKVGYDVVPLGTLMQPS
jgi:hypothetical protein